MPFLFKFRHFLHIIPHTIPPYPFRVAKNCESGWGGVRATKKTINCKFLEGY